MHYVSVVLFLISPEHLISDAFFFVATASINTFLLNHVKWQVAEQQRHLSVTAPPTIKSRWFRQDTITHHTAALIFKLCLFVVLLQWVQNLESVHQKWRMWLLLRIIRNWRIITYIAMMYVVRFPSEIKFIFVLLHGLDTFFIDNRTGLTDVEIKCPLLLFRSSVP